jgi:hypothetical protein
MGIGPTSWANWKNTVKEDNKITPLFFFFFFYFAAVVCLS